MSNTFFNFKFDLEPNVIDMIYDLLRMSTIQLITQIMFYMNNSSLSLFNETFIKTFIFINISIIFYYLVIRRLFSFVSNDYLNVSTKSYAGTPPIGSSSTMSPSPPSYTPPSYTPPSYSPPSYSPPSYSPPSYSPSTNNSTTGMNNSTTGTNNYTTGTNNYTTGMNSSSSMNNSSGINSNVV